MLDMDNAIDNFLKNCKYLAKSKLGAIYKLEKAIGKHRGYFSRVESGHNHLKLEDIIIIIAELDTDFEYLLTEHIWIDDKVRELEQESAELELQLAELQERKKEYEQQKAGYSV